MEAQIKSVIVEDGVATKTIAAYIDLNPVRAGMVKDPAEYRAGWHTGNEAQGDERRGGGEGTGEAGGYSDRQDATVPGEAFHGWGGDREPEFRERGVCARGSALARGARTAQGSCVAAVRLRRVCCGARGT